jgi:hypothetical protein
MASALPCPPAAVNRRSSRSEKVNRLFAAVAVPAAEQMIATAAATTAVLRGINIKIILAADRRTGCSCA